MRCELGRRKSWVGGHEAVMEDQRLRPAEGGNWRRPCSRAAPHCDSGGKIPVGVRLLAAKNSKSQQSRIDSARLGTGIARLPGRHVHQAETSRLLNAAAILCGANWALEAIP